MCNFEAFFGTRHIETTKRYARLANGNVGNFQEYARTVITVRAYSVDWLLHLHIKVIPTTSIRGSGISVPRFYFEAQNARFDNNLLKIVSNREFF